MKFIGVRELRNEASRVWKELKREKEIIITSNGKPIAIMSDVTEKNLEDFLSAIRRARALTAVARMQSGSLEKGTDGMTLENINREIEDVRAERSG